MARHEHDGSEGTPQEGSINDLYGHELGFRLGGTTGEKEERTEA